MKSIRFRLMIYFTIILLFISVGLSIITDRSSSKSLESEARQNLMEMARQTAVMLEIQYDSLIALNEAIANRTELRSMDWNVQREALIEEVERNGFLRAGVADTSGYLQLTNDTSVNVTVRPYFWKAMDGISVVNDPVPTLLDDFDLVVMTTSPIYDYDHNVTGLLLVARDGWFFNTLIDNIAYGYSEYAYVINKEGITIAHPNQSYVMERQNVIMEAENNPALSPLAEIEKKMISRQPGFDSYRLEKIDYYIAYAPVAGTDWTVAIRAPRQEVMSTLSDLKRELNIATILFIIVSLSMAYIAGTLFSRPIINLQQLFNRAAEGDLTVRAAPKRKDEIGNAGQSFNKMMEQINNLTYFDAITGLPNFRVLAETFYQICDSLPENETVAIIIFGADSFSRINERYGYQKGNMLLSMITRKMQENLKKKWHLFRGQSDELIILCETSSQDQPAPEVARRLLKLLQIPNNLDNETVFLNFNVGIAYYPDHGETIEDLLKNAGFAKNLAKIEGPGKVKVFDADSKEQVLVSQKLEESLALAVTREELFLVYQPIMNLKNGSIRGLEALLRWKHPEEGHIPPGIFIPIAERSGLIHLIGQWVLLEACKQHALWSKKGSPPLIISVNVSGKQLEMPDFMDTIHKTVQQTGIEPTQLELELTESSVVHQVEENMVRLKKLQDMGVKISIDDFGTGYSSLNYMVRLPVNSLKIDRSFITDLGKNSQSKTIVSTIIAMGKSLKLDLIAEGIETSEQLEIIRDNSCPMGQGFYFSKPELPAVIEKLFL